MDTGLFAPSVATYATPNSVYGSMDSTVRVTAPMNATAAPPPTPAALIFRLVHKMRPQMSVVQRAFVAITVLEYARATLGAIPTKKSALGLPEK